MKVKCWREEKLERVRASEVYQREKHFENFLEDLGEIPDGLRIQTRRVWRKLEDLNGFA